MTQVCERTVHTPAESVVLRGFLKNKKSDIMSDF